MQVSKGSLYELKSLSPGSGFQDRVRFWSRHIHRDNFSFAET
jgi:hypothetical protein